MKKTSLNLLNEIMEMGFSKEEALEKIDFALDDDFEYENRKELSEEYLSDDLYESIKIGFIIEIECKNEMIDYENSLIEQSFENISL